MAIYCANTRRLARVLGVGVDVVNALWDLADAGYFENEDNRPRDHYRELSRKKQSRLLEIAEVRDDG